MSLRRLAVVVAKDGFVQTYSHLGGKLGVIVEMSGEATEANLEKTLSVNLSKLSKYASKRLTEKDIVDPFNKQNAAQLIALFDKVQANNHPSFKAQEAEYNSALSDAEVTKSIKISFY